MFKVKNDKLKIETFQLVYYKYDIILLIKKQVNYMHKIVSDTKVSFYDESENEIMYIDYSTDECIWYFKNSDEILITENEELFEPLKNIVLQQYEFGNEEVLKSFKNNNKIVWYSDCYYNLDNEWSRNSVSYVLIEYIDGIFKLKCTKPLDNIIDRKEKTHVITFSPLGNGKYTKNIDSGLTFQDDFIKMIYQELLKKGKVKELRR